MEINMENTKLNGESPQTKRKCLPWKQKTKLERYLIVICIVIFVAFISMIGVVLYLEHVYTRSKPPICTTVACRTQAGKIMSYMDTDKDPCEDFYDFACGTFFKVTIPPDNSFRYGSFDKAKERMRKISKDLLEAEGENDEPDFIKRTKMIYKACLDFEMDIFDIVSQLLNKTELYNWPILQHDNYENDKLVEKSMSVLEANGGMNPFYGIYGGDNDTINLYSGTQFGNVDIVLNDTDEVCIHKKKKYRALIIYTLFKARTPAEAIDTVAEEILECETEFSNIIKNSERENKTETTLKEMADECPELGWTDVIKYLFGYFGHSEEYSDEIRIQTRWKGYFEKLCSFFRKIERRKIYNYLIWRFLATNLREFDTYFMWSYQKIMENEYNFQHFKADGCLRGLHYNMFSHGLNYLVIRHLKPDDIIKEVRQYNEEIKNVMDHMFSQVGWLDGNSKDIARERLRNITALIGYSSGSLDYGLLDKYYSEVNVTDNHIDNVLYHAKRSKRAHLFNDTRMLYDEIEITDPLGVGAYFMGSTYVIELGAMQPPFYTEGAPKYIKYAGVPFIIAHELSHAFDSLDMECEYDNTTIPWPDGVLETFKERVQCYVDQYSQYPIDDNGTMVDGNFTIRDNIADNSGIIQAYNAYEKYVVADEEPRLPGLDYTSRQLFFIMYAQFWCEIVVDPKKAFENDGHSPSKYRVLGPLQNFPRFAEQFNCPVGSKMNPKDKCRLWG